MDTTKDVEASPAIARRHLLIGAAALVVAAAAGGFYLWRRPTEAVAHRRPPGEQATEVPIAELLKPDPLGDAIQGEANAPVTIVEYASMTCPHCAHFHETTYPEMKKKYIDTGKVRFIFREFPL